MSAIQDVLWAGMKALEPKSQLGGIYANKRGYHNKRENLPMPGSSFDYSIDEFAIDKQGPADEASAIDWTFPDAQSGDYKTISKYSKRLYAVRGGNDSRTVYMREFFGQIDNDSTVEGWDYGKDRSTTSDSSHLWHIHISIFRKYINSTAAMKAILSILKGETEEQWKAANARDVVFQYFNGRLPTLKKGDSDPLGINVSNNSYFVTRAQQQLQLTADGDYGPDTASAVKALAIPGHDGNTIDNDVWEKLFAMWGSTPDGTSTVKGNTRTITYQNFTNAKLPVLKKGDSDDAGGIDGTGTQYIKRAQRALKVDDDGEYGPATASAVKALGIEAHDGNTIDIDVWSQLYAVWYPEVVSEKKISFKN